MSLRAKLILLLSAVVISVALFASIITYTIASDKLKQRAERRLLGDAVLVAESIQQRFDAELRHIQQWASMPFVEQLAQHDRDPKFLSPFGRFFSSIVASEPYSSIYLINRAGDCVACDDPRRVYHPHCLKVISKKPGALSAYTGLASFGRNELSVATGRPIVPLTAPVWCQGRVAAILRGSIDMERLSREMLRPMNKELKENIYMFDPSLPVKLPEGHKLHAPTGRGPYRPPPKFLRLAFKHRTDTIFRYQGQDTEYLAAFAQTRNPSWVIVVVRPMDSILKPVWSMGKAMAAVAALTLLLLVGVVFIFTAPVVRRIELCREFAADISRGELDQRLRLGSRDEVGKLAKDLNQMAAQIKSNHQDLKDAERKYRRIFENAVEGIFQTEESGTILAANPRLAQILGAKSADDLVGLNVQKLYADPAQRADLMAMLRAGGEVSDFECDLIRLDGVRLQVMLHARAELNDLGDIKLINGIVEDVTDLRKTEAKARRAREAEELLLRTELEMLRYQVNPHFLFNTISSIRGLVLSAPKDGVKMLEALASFYRAILVGRLTPLSTVADELARIQLYLQIQKIRFGERLEVRMEIEPDAESVSIPIFIIQPLVENAVKFGQKSKADPLLVTVKACLEKGQCLITVANTGRWFRSDARDHASGTQLGLEYVRRCLGHYLGDAARLSTAEENGMVVVRIIFPVNEEADLA